VSGIVATVYGSTGFLGRYIVSGLGTVTVCGFVLTFSGKIGSQVIIPYRGEEKSYDHLKVTGDLGQIVPLKWDYRDKDSIRRSAQYSNVIINVMGRTFDTRNFTQRQVHVDAARNIAEVVLLFLYLKSTQVAKELGVERLIHVSALGAQKCSSDWGKTKVYLWHL
jgi:NADH dehydrogenase (ubiquinone) 1 alpha subcomplex subunit 9